MNTIEEDIKKTKLEVNNMILTGRLPMKRQLKLDELNKLITLSNLGWRVVCQETCPRLQVIMDKEEFKKNGKKKSVCVTLWFPNTINLVGVTSKKEASEVLNKIIKDLRKYVRGVFNGTPKS